MNRHNHLECEHKNLAYCKNCRVVYCKECTKEWSEPTYTYTIYPITNIPTWTYPGNNSSDTVIDNEIKVFCNHVELS